MHERRPPPRPPIVAGVVAIVIGALILGVWWGGHPDRLPGFMRDAFVGDSDTQLVDQALDVIQEDYYRAIPRTALVNRSIAGVVKSLDDRFSNYFDPAAYRQFQRAAEPSFSGVGMQVAPDRRGLRVVDVFPRTPAARAGIRDGDVIVRVDGRSIAGRPQDYAVGLIKGPAGTRVTLTVLNGGRRRQVRVTRARIDVPLVESRMVHAGATPVAYVRLFSFTAPGVHAQVGDAVRRLLARGAKGVVFDLRENPGGLLDEGVLTASVFIPKGPIVITDGRTRPRHVYTAEGGAIPSKVPLAVLIDRNSASAAEIVAGAIQDRHRGILVGTRSFGKGVFQEVHELPNGGALDITVGQYFLPSGRNLGGGGVKEGRGLTPDVRSTARGALNAALRALAPRLQ